MSAEAWLLAAPLLLVAATALVTLAVDAAASPRGALHVAAAGLAASALLFAATTLRPAAGVFGIRLGGTWGTLDAVGCGIAAAALLAGERRFRTLPQAGQVGALVALSAGGSVVLAGSFELPTFVVALELVALTGYGIVASARTARAYEAAMKYFVQGAVATGLLAYAVAILFGAFGVRLTFAQVPGAATPALTAAMVLLIAALAFKVGAFPFHSWAPDAYETAPAAATAYLATFPKIAALLALPPLLLGVFGAQQTTWAPVIAALAAASVVAGNLAGLRQVSFRRMLAYSGIAQVGYALIGVAAGTGGRGAVALLSVFYALAAAGAFIAAEAAGEGWEWDGRIATLAGLGARRPLLAASLAVCLLSLTGIPLTAGFWGKFLVFASAAQASTWLVVVGVLGSVVSFGYYGSVLRAVYLDESPEPEPQDELEAVIDEAVALAPRSVGAMAADAEGGSRTAERVVAAVALLLLAGGIAPLVWGIDVLSLIVH